MEPTILDAIKNKGTGPMPFPIDSGKFTAESSEEGILLKYTATIMPSQSSDEMTTIGSVTPYGIMIRYATDGYPRTPKEGILAVDDTDLFDKKALTKGGTITYGKEKTLTVVGLTNGETYYFSAFPYSYSGTFNTNYGKNVNGDNYANSQRVSCQWTGTKGTLTVNVTQDYNYKPLGEYTITLTPTSGGEAITKTHSGTGEVQITLDGGEYTMSATAPQYFKTPENKTVNVVGGQNQTESITFNLTISVQDLSWDEIKQVTNDGNAEKLFEVGSSKTIRMKYITKIKNCNDEPTLTDIDEEVYVDRFDILSTTGQPTVRFTTRDAVMHFSGRFEQTTDSFCRGTWGFFANPLSYEKFNRFEATIREYLNNNINLLMPADLAKNLAEVTLTIPGSGLNSSGNLDDDEIMNHTISTKLFPPNIEGLDMTTSSKRIKQDAISKQNVTYHFSSAMNVNNSNATAYEGVSDKGGILDANDNYYTINDKGSPSEQNYFPLSFCIG